MLPFTCSREALVACSAFPPHALALIPLSFAKVRLSPTLTLSPLMIWYSGHTALFLLLLARAAPAFLPTVLSVALRPLFPFWQAQYAQAFLLRPVPFCTLFAGLGSTYKSAISLLFSSCLTLVLSSPPCPLLHLSSYLKLCGRSGRNCLGLPVDTRPRTPLISFRTVQLRTLCAAHSLATLCLFTTSGSDLGELPGFWGSMVSRHAPIPKKGSSNQQQQQDSSKARFRISEKLQQNGFRSTL